MADTETATETLFARCAGAHDRDCAWHAVSAVAENGAESGDASPELVENAAAIIDDYCHCDDR
jgi:hypothetical protein